MIRVARIVYQVPMLRNRGHEPVANLIGQLLNNFSSLIDAHPVIVDVDDRLILELDDNFLQIFVPTVVFGCRYRSILLEEA